MAQQGNYTGIPRPFLIELDSANLSGETQLPLTSGGGLLKFLRVDSTDTNEVMLAVELYDKNDICRGKLGVYVIPAMAGQDGIEPAVNLYEEIGRTLDKDNAGNPLLELPAEYKLRVSASAITATKKVWVTGEWGTYAPVEIG